MRRMIANSRTPRCLRFCALGSGAAALAILAAGLGGCGQTAKTITAPSVNQVHTYFGAAVTSTSGVVTIDRTGNQITQSQPGGPTGVAPTANISGTFAASPTSFITITEIFAPDQVDHPGVSGGSALPCPLHGSWGLEIPGDGALVNLLSIGTSTSPVFCTSPPPIVPPAQAGPFLLAESSSCPSFAAPTTFLYITLPTTSANPESADYGTVSISNQGNAVTFHAQPFMIGQPTPLPASTVTGGCSISPFGVPVTAYPLNSNANSGVNGTELFAISPGGLLVDSAPLGNPNGGALGQNNNSSGAIGVAMPASSVDVSAVVGAKYSGFLYAPQLDAGGTFRLTTDGDGNPLIYDAAVLASAYGDNAGNSPACMVLQNSVAANLVSAGNGGTIAAPPSSSTTLFGGEFKNSDPSGASGMTERCDVAIDLGQQDSQSNGLFPNATIFIGENYPPATDTSVISMPCMGSSGLPCAFAFPAAAIVGKVNGQFVVFVTTPNLAPTLPSDAIGDTVQTPVSIYLFQKTQ